MTTRRCNWPWDGHCPTNPGGPHICARPPGHPPRCMCYCGTKAPASREPDPDTPDSLW
jgi:hypothetical protein